MRKWTRCKGTKIFWHSNGGFHRTVTMSVAVLLSCSRDLENVMQDNKPVSEEKELKEFSATVGKFVREDAMNPTTRTAIVTDENEDLQLVWAENDTIGIFPA